MTELKNVFFVLGRVYFSSSCFVARSSSPASAILKWDPARSQSYDRAERAARAELKNPAAGLASHQLEKQFVETLHRMQTNFFEKTFEI
jgi:hypothetical protein